jgi:hypothetical protein
MKTAKALLVAALVGLAAAAVSAPASAHGYYRGYYGGPRVTFGFYGPGYWGPGYWGGYPGYYGYGYGYAAPPVVVVPSEPRIYVERDTPPASSSGQQQWWYWCPSAKGYYPYVSTCSEGWQRVPPQPSQAPQ